MSRADDPVRLSTAQRCHSEPVTDVTGVGIRNPRPLPLPLGEVAERSEDGEGKQRGAASRRPLFRLVDKHSPYDKQFIYAGGTRGGKARLESDQMSRKALPCKACVERSDYFRAARRHKNNDIISGCRKSRRLFRQPERDGALAPSLCPCLKDVTTGSCPPHRRDRWGGTCRHPPGGAAPGSTRCP